MKNHGRREHQKAKSAQEPATLNHRHEALLHRLKTIRFRRSLLGGLSERDVWKKLEELAALYEAALEAERARYDALLQEYRTAPRTPGDAQPDLSFLDFDLALDDPADSTEKLP